MKLATASSNLPSSSVKAAAPPFRAAIIARLLMESDSLDG